jgi:transposase
LQGDRVPLLLAAQGLRNDQIAQRLNCRREVVSQWRKRFFEHGMAGLEDRPRRGRPWPFPPQVRAEVISLACELPAEQGVPLPRRFSQELTHEAVARGIVEQISDVTA